MMNVMLDNDSLKKDAVKTRTDRSYCCQEGFQEILMRQLWKQRAYRCHRDEDLVFLCLAPLATASLGLVTAPSWRPYQASTYPFLPELPELLQHPQIYSRTITVSNTDHTYHKCAASTAANMQTQVHRHQRHRHADLHQDHLKTPCTALPRISAR